MSASTCRPGIWWTDSMPWCWRAGPRSRATCRCPGRDLGGIYFAMEFLPQQNRRIGREPLRSNNPILATGKHVLVIGGGDTGSDCIGTSIRQGALSVTQLEIMPEPPEQGEQAADLAGLAAEAADLVEPGGRRRARLRGDDPPLLGRGRHRRDGRLRARRRQVPADRRQRIPAAGRSRAAGHGLRVAGARTAC